MKSYMIVNWVVDGVASPLHARDLDFPTGTMCGLPLPARHDLFEGRTPKVGGAWEPAAISADLAASGNGCRACLGLLESA